MSRASPLPAARSGASRHLDRRYGPRHHRDGLGYTGPDRLTNPGAQALAERLSKHPARRVKSGSIRSDLVNGVPR